MAPIFRRSAEQVGGDDRPRREQRLWQSVVRVVDAVTTRETREPDPWIPYGKIAMFDQAAPDLEPRLAVDNVDAAGTREDQESEDHEPGPDRQPPWDVTHGRHRGRDDGAASDATSAGAPMTVAFIYDAVYPFVIGGAEHRYYELARQMRNDHAVVFYSFEYWRDDPGGCLEGCHYVPVAAPRGLYHPNGRRRIGEALRFAVRLLPRLLASREEVWDVCSFPYVSVLAARAVNVIRRRTMVVTWLEFWDGYWNVYLGRWGFVGRWIERLAVRASPHIIAISERTRDRLVAAGCPREKITVITPGVVLPPTATSPFSEMQFELVYVGRLIEHKRVDLAVRAVACLKEQGLFVRLGIVGEGPDRESLETLTVAQGVEDRVKFLGRMASYSEVSHTLRSSKVLVVPSRREGFGLAVVQGWASGIPAVVCDEPLNAMADLITSPELGRVVSAVPVEIARACRDLLSEQSEERRRHLVAAAAGRPWSVVAAEVMASYRAAGREPSTQ